MRATFKHIRSDKVTRDSENTLITALYILISFGLIYRILSKVTSNALIYILIFLALAYSTKLIRKFYKDWVVKKDVIGIVKFETEKITISTDTEEILTSDILNIKLIFNYIQGKQYHSRDIIHNGLAKIKIISKAYIETDIVFLIETKSQLENLGKILKEYYRKQIKIDEFLGRNKVKTFLLRPNWKYEEKQKLKRELKLDSIS
jgi:hypothetical protein